jgi:hypothetical protein
LAGRAFILETPIDEPGDDRRNVRALWDLVGVSVKQAPKAVDGFSMTKAPKRAKVLGKEAANLKKKTKAKAAAKPAKTKKSKAKK